jgi:hypothetical protein
VRALVVLLVALGATALFFDACEKRTIELPKSYSGEAARNKYLAAQRLVVRMGGNAKSSPYFDALEQLPPTSGTLVIPTARHALGRARSEGLLEWAKQGGHLVLVTWQLWDDEHREPDLILDALGVHQFMTREDDGESPEAPDANAPPEESAPAPDETPDEPAAEPDGADGDDEAADTGDDEAADGDEEPELARAHFADRKRALQVQFDPQYRLELTDEAQAQKLFTVSDSAGLHLVTLHCGRGLVTAMTDDRFMTQPAIGEHDHAELLYRLTRLGERSGPVWFIYGDRYPSLLQLLVRYAWMIALSGVAFAALWLWAAARRFGPIAPDPPNARRELMEHVRAAGLLQWRRGGARALLEATREALLARMRERHPAFHSLEPAQQAEQLARLSGLPRERVLAALEFRKQVDPARFAGDVATLEKLRRAL